jgi:hypothetical protein
MESIQNKQKDQLAQRDAQIDHLKQELNKKHLPTPSTSYSQKTRLSPKYVKAASDTISHAIAEAITSALHQSPNPDMAKAISTMVHAYFPSNLPVHELNQSFLDKTTISTSLQHVITKNMRPTITESVSFIPAHFYLPPVPDLVCTDDGGEWVDLKQDHLDIQGHQDKVSERDDSVSMKEEKDHAPIKDEEEDHASIKEEDHASIKEEEDDHLSMEQQDDDVSLEQEEEDRLSLEQEEEDRLSLEQEDDNASMKHKVDDVSITEEKENDLSLKEDRLSLKEEPSTPSPLQQENNKLTVVVESQQGVDACVQTVSIDYTEEISRAVDQLVEFALPSPDTESFDLTASSIQDEQEEPHVMRSIQQPAFLHINKWAMVCLLALIYSHYYF